MALLPLRSATAIILSLWIGVLACLLGCAKPAVAGTRHSSSELAANICPQGGREGGDSCCQHGHDDSGKNSHYAKSCCPTETALTQRKSAPEPPTFFVHVDALALPGGDASIIVFTSADSNVPAPPHTGRDILRQVHVLRI